MVADVAGYSRLMELDESRTHAELIAIREQVFAPFVTSHGGRIVKTSGDAVLAEFASATSALRCAIEVQAQMLIRNASIPANERIEFRIGINLGDVIIDGEDIFGDGINIAARLESLAAPGGICVSASVCEQVHEDLGARFEDLGDQQVKNVSRPIHVYRVMPAERGAVGNPTMRLWHGDRSGRRATFAVVASLAVAIVLVCAILFREHLGWLWEGSLADRGMALKPLSVAIPPFATRGGTWSDAQADALARDTAATLAREAPYVWVVSSGSNIATRPIDAARAGRELGVRYVVDGEVAGTQSAIRASAALIDTTTGRQLWSTVMPLAADQQGDAAAAQLATEIRVALVSAESRRVASQGNEESDATADWLRGIAVDDGSLEGARRAAVFYGKALQRDPRHAGALIGLASRRWRNCPARPAQIASGWCARRRISRTAPCRPTATTHAHGSAGRACLHSKDGGMRALRRLPKCFASIRDASASILPGRSR